ncbi:MAG: hypothetical protein R3E89_08855 [Thiolinea sp.]
MNSPFLASWRSTLTSVFALIVTVYGLANVMPAIGSFRIGPFPMEFFAPASSP